MEIDPFHGNLPFDRIPIRMGGDVGPVTKYFEYDAAGNIILGDSFDAEDPWWGLTFTGYPEQPVIVGRTKAMIDAFMTLQKAAQSPSYVLIEGESGTGKELWARSISCAHGGPFEAVDCSIPNAGVNFEDRFFGRIDKILDGTPAARGFFQLADGGTGLFDNIHELTLDQQGKLLRVLDRRPQHIRRLGSDKDETVNVRVVAASNRDIESLVQQGLFKPDLHARLKVVKLKLPPLRERKNDIPLLIVYFLLKNRGHYQRNITMIAAPTLELARSYDWPLNVRELHGALESALALGEGPILCPHDIPCASGRSLCAPDLLCPKRNEGEDRPLRRREVTTEMVLEILRTKPGVTAKQLAEVSSCSLRTVERILDPLLNKSVERRNDERDARIYRYYLTNPLRLSG